MQNSPYLIEEAKDEDFNMKFLTMYMDLKKLFCSFSNDSENPSLQYQSFLAKIVQYKNESRETLINYLANECSDDLINCFSADPNLDELPSSHSEKMNQIEPPVSEAQPIIIETNSKNGTGGLKIEKKQAKEKLKMDIPVQNKYDETNHELHQSTKSPRLLYPSIYRTSFLIQNCMKIILDFLTIDQTQQIQSIYYPEDDNDFYNGVQISTPLIEFQMQREIDGYKRQINTIENEIKPKIEKYNETLRKYRQNWKIELSNIDEDSAEKRLFKQFSDYAYVVDVINRRNFWHQDDRTSPIFNQSSGDENDNDIDESDSDADLDDI